MAAADVPQLQPPDLAQKKAANREVQRPSFSSSRTGRKHGHGDIALRNLIGAGRVSAAGLAKEWKSGSMRHVCITCRRLFTLEELNACLSLA